jgi:hypothetical protein
MARAARYRNALVSCNDSLDRGHLSPERHGLVAGERRARHLWKPVLGGGESGERGFHAFKKSCHPVASYARGIATLRVLRLVRTLPTHPNGDRMQRLVGRAPLVGALMFIAGCGTDGGGTGPASIVGSYRLASVDGAPIPVTLAPGIVTGADRSDVYFGALVLGADLTARMSVCTRHTTEPTVWVTYSDQQATYTLRADALELAWNAGGATQARRESDAIAVPLGYNTVTLQLRFERSEPRAPDAEPCL